MTAALSLSTVLTCGRPRVAASPQQRGAVFIDLPTASARSGLSLRQLRRLCSAWQNQGLAQLRRPDAGGRAEWYVREDADPRLARVKFGDAIRFNPQDVSDENRRLIAHRRSLLSRYHTFLRGAYAEGLDRGEATEKFLRCLELVDGVCLSAKTLWRWERRLSEFGVAGLADGRRDRPEPPADDDPFIEQVIHFYLNSRKPDLTVCHRLALQLAAERGWRAHSIHACRRRVKSIEAATLALRRGGPEAFTNEAEPFVERDYSTLQSNEIWVSDHHQWDVLVNDGGKLVRPWITAWQDMRSRKIVGYCVFCNDPNSDTILTSFRAAVLEHGLPSKVYIDNGKDYDSYALNGRTKKDRWRKRSIRVALDPQRAGVFGLLDIGVIHAQKYHGQSKVLERWFGTMERDTVIWPTYTGNKPANKPHDLQLQIERGNAPAFADFAAWVDKLIASLNATPSKADGLDGRSPDQSWLEQLVTKRTATAEQLDVYCLRATKPVKVGQNGVRYHGLRYGAYDPSLSRMQGREVVLRIDERDVSRVQVWSADGKFVCVATANQKLPANADAQELRAALAAKRKASRQIKDFYQNKPRLAEDLSDLMFRGRAQKSAAAAQLPPPSIKPVRGQLDDQLPKLERARQSPAPMPPGESRHDLLRKFGEQMRQEEHAERLQRERASLQPTPSLREIFGFNREVANAS